MRSCRDRRRQAPARSCPAEWLAVTPGKDARRTLARARPQGAIDPAAHQHSCNPHTHDSLVSLGRSRAPSALVPQPRLPAALACHRSR